MCKLHSISIVSKISKADETLDFFNSKKVMKYISQDEGHILW